MNNRENSMLSHQDGERTSAMISWKSHSVIKSADEVLSMETRIKIGCDNFFVSRTRLMSSLLDRLISSASVVSITKTIPPGVSGRFSLVKRKAKEQYSLDVKDNFERSKRKDVHPKVSEGMYASRGSPSISSRISAWAKSQYQVTESVICTQTKFETLNRFWVLVISTMFDCSSQGL